MADKTYLEFVGDSEGGRTTIHVFSDDSFLGFRRLLREMKIQPGFPTGVDYDCSGRLCWQRAELLKVTRDEGGAIVGVVAISTAIDI